MKGATYEAARALLRWGAAGVMKRSTRVGAPGRTLLRVGAVAGLLFSAFACRGNLGLDSGRSYPCAQEGAEDQCPATWRCGLDNRCHSSDPGAYACDRAHENTDCEGGWICGLDGRCHAPDQPADYVCHSDTDCVGGWRCGADGRCVDSTLDALAPALPKVELTSQLVSPLLTTGRPAFYATSSTPFRSGATGYQLVAFINADKLTLALRDTSRNRAEAVESVSLSGRTVKALAVAVRWVLVAHDLGITIYEWDDQNRRIKGQAQLAGVDADSLVPISEVNVYAVAGGRFKVIDAKNANVAFDFALPASGAGPTVALQETVFSMAMQNVSLAATKTGLYLAKEVGAAGSGQYMTQNGSSATGPTWVPVSPPGLPNAACDGGTGNTVTRLLRTETGNPLAFYGEVSAPDGGVVGLTWLAQMNGVPPTEACSVPSWAGLFAYTCLPCPAGTSYRDFFTAPVSENGNTRDRLEVRCAAADGREKTYRLDFNSSSDGGLDCRHQQPDEGVNLNDTTGPLTDEARYAQGGAGAGALFGKHGQVWFIKQTAQSAFALEVDRPMVALTECSAALFGMSQGDNTFRLYGSQPGAGFSAEGDFGTDPNSAVPQSQVDGKDCWLVGSQANTVFVGQLGENGMLDLKASTGPTSSTLPPYHAAPAGLRDGGEALLVSVGDALLAAELGGEGTRKLETRLSPSARSPILSFASFPTATLQPDDGALAGYVLSESGLSAFKAVTLQRWRSEALTLPDGNWLEVWTDGHAGRVGYADGRVYSLPSRVPIADAIPGGRVFDFAQYCGGTFAVGTGGLYQLRPPSSGPIGVWEQVPGLPTVGEEGWTDAKGSAPRLYVTAGKLYAINAFGQTVRYQAASCP